VLEDNGIEKTIHIKIAKKYKQTGIPKFVEPYNTLVSQIYAGEITQEEFLEQFLCKMLVK